MTTLARAEAIRVAHVFMARSEAALEELDRYRHVGSASLEREALRRLLDEHEHFKKLLDELDVDGGQQDSEERETCPTGDR